MVGLSCCRSNEAVNLSANTAPTFLANDEDAVDVLLAAQQHHAMGKSQWNAPYVSNIRLSDLDSLLSASASGLSQSKRGSGSSSASSSLRQIIQLRRHHSYPSVRYFDGDSQDETTEDDFDDEEDDGEEEQPFEEGDAVYVAESPSRTSIPREIMECAGTPVSSAYSVASTLDTTPRVQSLLLHRLRVRRMSSHSYLLQEQLHDNKLIRGNQDNDDATSVDDDENIVPVPTLRRHSFPSSTGSLSQSTSPCHPDDDEGEEPEAILYPSHDNDNDASHWNSDIPREIGPKRKPRLPTRRRRSSTSLLRLRVWGTRRPPSLRATKQFVHQLHAMS